MWIWIRNTAFFPCIFADLLFAGWDTKDLRINCGLAHLRNLQIFDCGMSPKICDLQTNKKKFACQPLLASRFFDDFS
jgi:hypothetical protein